MTAQPRYCSLFGCGQPGVVYSVHRGSWLCGTHAAGNFIAGTTTDPSLTYPLAGRPEDLDEIAALRAKLAEAERDRDLAERKASVCREDAEINAKRAEAAEDRAASYQLSAEESATRVAALEAGIVKADRIVHDPFSGESISVRHDRAWQLLRALLAPAESKPCATCGGFGRVCWCHGEPPRRDCIYLIPCPKCRKRGGA